MSSFGVKEGKFLGHMVTEEGLRADPERIQAIILSHTQERKVTIKEGLGVGIILVIPKEKMHLYAIRLKFHASNHVRDYEALLAGLAASTNQGMKDLHVFIDSLTLVAQEVSVGIKTRPSVEETSSSKKGKAASNAPRAKPNYNPEASGSN
ncbi:reverse transcriptase domain-containing protein [Tanacetum coccineum]